MIAGTGPMEAELRSLAGDAAGTSIFLLGFQQPSENLALMAHADLFVLPSRYEPHGIVVGEALAAGMPEDRMPVVTVAEDEFTPSTYNDPALTQRVRGALTEWLGADHVKTIDPEMGGEDFSLYGRTAEHVPICMFRVGAVDPARVAESERTGVPLPSLHSSKFAPLPEPTIKTGVTAMTAVVLDLLAKK